MAGQGAAQAVACAILGGRRGRCDTRLALSDLPDRLVPCGSGHRVRPLAASQTIAREMSYAIFPGTPVLAPKSRGAREVAARAANDGRRARPPIPPIGSRIVGLSCHRCGNLTIPLIDSLRMRRSFVSGPRRGLPHQQSQRGSLPPAPVKVGRFHACGAPGTALATAPFLLQP